MPLRMTPTPAPSRERKFRGNWHVAGSPAVVISGVLDISKDGRASLDLNGSLLAGQEVAQTGQVIFGRAHDGEKITLIETSFRSQHAPWFNDGDQKITPPPIATEQWEAWAVAVGAQLPDGQKTNISKLVFRSPMLTAWADTLAPEFKHAKGPRTIGGSGTIPDPLTADIGFADLTFGWTHRSRGDSLDLYPEIEVTYRTPTDIEESWHTTVVPLLQMLTFFVGAGDSVRLLRYTQIGADELTVSHGHDSYGWPFWGGDFELINASWMGKDQGREAPFHAEQLLPGYDVDPRFATLIPAWFELQKSLSGAALDYFSIQMFGSMTSEEAFYRVVRALEVTHGVLDPTPKISPEDKKTARAAIKAALDGHPHRDFILSRMQHIEAPSLKDRLIALFGMAGPRLRNFAEGGVDVFAASIVKTRDMMTHAGAGGPLSGADLTYARVVLDLLMREVLLVQLGFTPTEADECALRTERARLLLYPVTPRRKVGRPKPTSV